MDTEFNMENPIEKRWKTTGNKISTMSNIRVHDCLQWILTNNMKLGEGELK